MAKSVTKHVSTGRLVEQSGDRYTFAVSTSSPDRDNDTVDQKSLRWEAFDINPTATLSHDTEVIPVGKWLPDSRRITMIQDPESGEQVEATLMDFVPNPHTQAGRETGKSVADDFLGGASISFLPDEDGTEKNLHGGQHYEGARVTEVAVCAVPANQGATRRAAMLCKSLRSKIVNKAGKFQVGDKVRNGTGGMFARSHPTGEIIDYDPRMFAPYRVRWNPNPEDTDLKPYEGQYKESQIRRSKSMPIKFWRHKVQKSRVRVLLKDLPAFAAHTPEDDEKFPKAETIEPLDEEPKAEDMTDWEEEEMGEPEHQEPKDAATTAILQADGWYALHNGKRVAGPFKTEVEAEQAAGEYVPKSEEPPKTEDYAEQVHSRADELAPEGDEELAWDDAVDAAMEEEQVPAGMKAAVKAMAKKKRGVKKGPADEEGPFTVSGVAMSNHQTRDEAQREAAHLNAKYGTKAKDELTPGETETKDAMSDCVSHKIPIFAKEHPDWDQKHVEAAAFGYCGEKALKRGVTRKTLEKIKPHVLKACKKDVDPNADPQASNDPVGLKALKAWHGAVSEGMKGLHESEHQHVMDAGNKAMGAFSKAAQKAYNFALGAPEDNPEDDIEEEEETEKDMEPTEIDGKWTIYDPTNDEYVGEFESQEEAQHGIADMANPDKGEKSKAGVKIWKRWPANRKVRKSMNKATKATIGDAVEFMEGCSESKDMPKFMKSGHKHHAAALKGLIEDKAVTPEEEEKASEAEAEELCKHLQTMDERMEAMDRKLFQHFGRQYRKN